MKRVVYTFAIGKTKFAEAAMGLGRSLKLIGDSATRVVVTDRADFPWDECFDLVLPPSGASFEWLFFNKLDGLTRTDADQVLFVDADCLAFKRLDDIFDFCSGKGLCVQGELVSDGRWHIDVAEFCRENGCAGIPKFNGGMIYYERTPECEAFISKCFEIGSRAKAFGFDRTDLPINDEIGISIAMAQTGNGFLIPDVMDFQNSATGLIGKLHLDVRSNTCQFVCRRFDVRVVEPYIFHASRYMNFFIYWRQLKHLRHLSDYAKTKPFGYMSFWHKLQRSVERRLLKHVYRKI
jgi:hypothetical protein